MRNVYAVLLIAAVRFALAGEPPTDKANEAQFLRNIRQITFSGSKSGEPYFSADGREIVFQGVRDAENPFYQIYRFSLETGQLTRLSNGVGKTTCPFFHPQKKNVIFASSHLDAQSGSKQRQEIEAMKAAPARRYAWDFDSNFDIFAFDSETKALTRLTEVDGYDAECSYSPNGKSIVFCSMRDKDAEIYSMDADGKNQRRLTNEKGYDGGPFFSPDGKQIVWRHFDDEAQTLAEVWTMNIDGSNKKQVTTLKSISWAPIFHPSMKWIVFASNFQDVAFEIYAIRPDGSDLTRLTYSTGFDSLMCVSPDGRSLLWTSNRSDDKSQLFIADLHLPGDAELDGEPLASLPCKDAAINKLELRRRMFGLMQQANAGNLEHEMGKLFMAAQLQPAGTIEKVEETAFIFGPSVVAAIPPKADAPVIVATSRLNPAHEHCISSWALTEGGRAFEEVRTTAKPGLLAIAGNDDELPRLYSSARSALALRKIEPAPRIGAFVSLNGLGKVRDARLVIRGAGTSPAWAQIAEQLAARHPKIQLSMENDPAASEELQQFVASGIPSISVGGPSETLEFTIDPQELTERALARETAVIFCADLFRLLARHETKIEFSRYDAAAVRAAKTASSRPYLGTQPDFQAGDAAGVKIKSPREGSPAEKAGLKAGDVITELNGKPVKNAEEYLKALEGVKIGVEITIVIQRDGKTETLKITPSKR